MLDFKFTSPDLPNEVIIRTDGHIMGPKVDYNMNISVVETYGLNDRRPTAAIDTEVETALIGIKKINYKVKDLIALAEEHNLNLEVASIGSAVPEAPFVLKVRG